MKIKFSVILFIIIIAAVPVLAIASAVDPSAYTPSARVLGLGRAYVGLADDAAALYLNPAGISRFDSWKVTSMSGKFLDDYSYLSVTGVYPTRFGVFGVGYDTYNIGGAQPTTVDPASDPDDPVYMADSTQPLINNYNQVLILGYATKLAKNFGLGANIRLYSTGMSGDRIIEGNGSGTELDLGLIYQAKDWLSLGASALNLLPYSAGGKLTYAGGHTESYPAVLKVGGAVNALGEENSLFKLGAQKLVALLDLDYSPTIKDWPVVYHAGIEWTPYYLLTLRAGIDQSAMGDGLGGKQTMNDMTSGVGVNYGGFRFDYSYHQYAAISGIDNHTFSLSFAPAAPRLARGEKVLAISEPKDKTLTFGSKVDVKGKLIDLDAARAVLVNRNKAPLSLKGDFYVELFLKEGKNAISVEAQDKDQKTVDAGKVRLLKLSAFPDVAPDYWVAQPISLLAMANIITGYPNGNFVPEGNITRAEMCSLLMKAKSSTALTPKSPLPEGEGTFRDVSAKHWAAQFIADAAELGVVKGYPGNLFKPNGKITRAEGLAMIARFAGIPEDVYARQFPDIEASHWAAKLIAGSSKAGLLEYLKGKDFEPNRQLTRAETVEMLQRTEVVQSILKKDLLNWDSY